ncbi:TIGR03668 family PPOX class F420-dependent oxidoreductase [Rhizohabitans arisaemae]|uniref:TIGR03668 family PPOX class F420-dependent oxidoreductase n=1 Tax=Rhizohabitans arisaemae TaxID=2720610 RepID=UPI0024B1FC30|nr:TIGR03668 family PPOX class F420-dependent oxidoreductase [Rhizohabitans arisaemae]
MGGVDADRARARFTAARVARLASLTPDASGGVRPHLVPVTFALDGDTVLTAIDDKPKSTTDLRRLRNIRACPRVCLLADHYEEDWTALWWVRADGRARVVTEEPERLRALAALRAKYPAYRGRPPGGPVVAIEVERWSGWSFTPG